MKLARELFIPKGSMKVAHKLSDAVAYAYTDKDGRPCARVFFGKQSKPVASHYYRDECAREKHVAQIFEQRAEIMGRKAEWANERKAAGRGMVSGDILVASWGYDQTNVDFYQVLRLVGDKSVEVRKIGSKRTERESGNSMADYCVADPQNIIGEPMVRRAMNGSVRIDDCRNASKWEGREQYRSWYA
jgi:hypothetical protein